jgi:hypothetical protein
MNITYSLAMAAGRDAADRQMRSAGRTCWNLSDRNLAAKIANNLLDKMEAAMKEPSKEVADLQEIEKVVDNDFAKGDNDLIEVAEEWQSYGFDAEQVDSWLNARVFTAIAAHNLFLEGLNPDDVKWIPEGGYDTIGYMVANCDMTAEKAKTLVKE